jgi:hypothetical protein
MSLPLPQSLKDFLGYTDDPKNQTSLLDMKVSKKTGVVIGTMRAGKTTHLAGLAKTCQLKASEPTTDGSQFNFVINEGSGNIHDDIAELGCGHFPPATEVKSNNIKPGFLFEWVEPGKAATLGKKIVKQLYMPVLDYAGEELVQLIPKVKNAKTLEQAMEIQNTDQLTNIVTNASALIIIINATRAEQLSMIFEPEPQLPGMSRHPDVNMVRLAGPILRFKNDNPRSPRLEKIFIVITACDRLFPIAKKIAEFTNTIFDPLPADGNIAVSQMSLDSFMRAFFPQTHSLLKSLKVPIQYFPSYFELEKDVQGKIMYWDEAKKQPKIKTGNIFDSSDWVSNVGKPKYTEYWFNREIEALKMFATKV